MKILTISLMLLTTLTGCATLTDGGSKVHLEIVTKDTLAVDTAKKKLEGQGCTFVSNIEASIAAGSSDEVGRLIIGLKNKTAEAGGNAVISSLEANMGMPIYTKGIVYKCKESLKSNDV
jgi:hypothetical protein